MSLRNKIIAVLLFFSILPVAIIGTTAVLRSQRMLQEQIGASSLEFARLSLQRINEYLYSKLQSVHSWSHSVSPSDIANKDKDGRISDFLAKMTALRSEFHYAIVLNLEGEVIAASRPELIGDDLHSQAGFIEAAEGKESIRDVSFNPTADGYAVVISFPLTDLSGQGEVVGVLSASLAWENVNAMISDLTIAGQQQDVANHIMLFDQNGLVISCFSPEEIFTDNLIDAGMKSALYARDKKEGSLLETSEHGLRSFSTYTHQRKYKDVPELDWGLVILQDPNEVFASVSSLKRSFAYILLVFVVVVVVVSYVFAGKVSIPILNLASAAQAIGKGDLDKRIEHAANDEIGILVDSFNQMAEDLSRTTTSIERLNREIAERKKAERRLENSNNLRTAIIEGTMDCVFAKDLQDRYILANNRTLQVWGKSEAEAIGKNDMELFDADTGRQMMETDREIMASGETRTFEETTNNDAGTITWLTTKGPFKDENGNTIGVIGVARDITERIQFQKQLEEAKEQAEAANIAKSRFLAQMSHEIRTPMSVIMSFADLMEMDELTDEQNSQTKLLVQASKSLLQMIDDILDVSKIEAGKLALNPAEHNLKKLLDDMEFMMRPLAEEKGLQFSVVCGEALPLTFYNDYNRIQQCLLNLIGNAIKFTEKGRIRLKASLEDKDQRPFIRFDIEDTGIGIAPDKLETIFALFTQIDMAETRKYSGSGLGLTIARQLAQLLGGDLTVTSEIGKGSVFSLLIPAEVDATSKELSDEEESVDQSIRESQTKDSPRFSGKVLMTEDYEPLRRILGGLLERFGLDVTFAGNGEEAIEITGQQDFDLIFMDMQMPGLDGYAATGKLRNKGITTPIVALTAYAMQEDRDKCIEAGCDDYISKPINKKELKRILTKYVSAENDAI